MMKYEDRFKCTDCKWYQEDRCKPYIRYDTLRQISECDEFIPDEEVKNDGGLYSGDKNVGDRNL
jgi:hypothetical protein